MTIGSNCTDSGSEAIPRLAASSLSLIEPAYPVWLGRLALLVAGGSLIGGVRHLCLKRAKYRAV
jgi:hypothetical protein